MNPPLRPPPASLPPCRTRWRASKIEYVAGNMHVETGGFAMPDLGLTHVALTARDLDASIAFYGKYAGTAVVHRRVREGVRSVWLSDHTRPFVIVLVEAAGQQDHPLGPFGQSRRRLRKPGGDRSVICRGLPRGPTDTRSDRCGRPRWLYRADCRPRRPFARALLWSGGRARRAVGEERMSWGALGLLYLGLKPRRGDEWRRPRLACTGPRTKQYQRLRRVNPAERSCSLT